MTGIVITLLLIPTGVAAKALKVTGIVGTSGSVADVTTTHQLQVGETSPSNFYASGGVLVHNAWTTIAAPAGGSALIVQSIHISVNATGGIEGKLLLATQAGGGCSSPVTDVDTVVVTSDGTTPPLSYEPGLVIPDGSALCALVQVGQAFTAVYGYSIPAAAA